MPTPAPMIASGMISQFSAPRSGTKATTAQISATNPMISETMLNMASSLALFRWLRQPWGPDQRRHVKRQRDPNGGEGNEMRGPQRLAIPNADHELQRRGEELQHTERRVGQPPRRCREQHQRRGRDDAGGDQQTGVEVR